MALKLPTIPGLQAPTAGGIPAANAFALATGKAPVSPTPTPAPLAAPVTAPATPVAPVAPVTTIPASKLTPQATPTYPTAPAATPNTPLQASLAAIQEQALGIQSSLAKQQEAAATTPPVSSRQSVLDRILGLGEDLSGKGDFAAQAQKDQDTAGKAQKVTDLTNQYRAKEREYDNQIRKIEQNNKKGIGAEVAADQIALLTRQKNQELGDIAIQQSAALGNYDTARQIAEDLVTAKYEPVEQEIKLLQDYYQLSANDLTESEKITVQEKIQEKQDAVAFEREKDLYQYRQQIDQQDPLYQANLANVYSQISARAAESTGNPNGTINGKPQTAAQGLVQGYADRLAQADVTINKVGEQFASPTAIGGVLPNFLKSGDRQVFEQAQRNFINAILRRESGAAIATSEFDSAARQYFPQPGDRPEVLQQKAANRQTVINSLYNQANVPQPVLPGSVISYDGKDYQVGDDGETLTEL